MSLDTHPDAEQFQISLRPKASAVERIFCACSLSETVIKLSHRAIRRTNRKLSRYPRAYARGPMNFNVFYFQPWHSTTGSRPWSSANFDKWELNLFLVGNYYGKDLS